MLMHSSSIVMKRAYDIASVGNLIDKIGYKLTTFSEQEIVEEFDDGLHLMDYLSRTGMSFAGKDCRESVRRDLLLAASALYSALYGHNYQPNQAESGNNV